MAEMVTFSVSVFKETANKTTVVVKNAIRSVEKSSTWFDLFDYCTDRLSILLPLDVSKVMLYVWPTV